MIIEIGGFPDYRILHALFEHFKGSVEVIATLVTGRLAASDQARRGLDITIGVVGQNANEPVCVLGRILDQPAACRDVGLDFCAAKQDGWFVGIILPKIISIPRTLRGGFERRLVVKNGLSLGRTGFLDTTGPLFG